MGGHQPFVHRVLGHFVVIVDRAFHARCPFVGRQDRQDVAACGNLDAMSFWLHGQDFAHRIAAARHIDQDNLAAFLVFQRVEHPLCCGGEICGALRGVFFGHDGCARSVQRRLECGNPVAAKGIVFGQCRHKEVFIGCQRQSLRLHVHR